MSRICRKLGCQTQIIFYCLPIPWDLLTLTLRVGSLRCLASSNREVKVRVQKFLRTDVSAVLSPRNMTRGFQGLFLYLISSFTSEGEEEAVVWRAVCARGRCPGPVVAAAFFALFCASTPAVKKATRRRPTILYYLAQNCLPV